MALDDDFTPRPEDEQALDSQADLDALNADEATSDELAAEAAVEAQESLDRATAEAEARAELSEPSDEELDAAAQDPLNEEVEITVVDEFRTEDGSPIEVSVGGLTEKFPADGSVITVTERSARLYEESPAIARVPKPDSEEDAE